MKKNYSFVVVVVFFFTVSSFTKAQSSDPWNSYISVGYGFGNLPQAVLKTYETYDDCNFKMMGPIFGKYEYAINEQIGFGVVFSYASANVSYTNKGVIIQKNPIVYYKEQINWSSYSILMRFNWHFNKIGNKFDPYIGVGTGYREASWKYEDNDPNSDNSASLFSFFPVGFETTAGVRFMATDFLGIYTEFGFAKAIVQFGVITKF